MSSGQLGEHRSRDRPLTVLGARQPVPRRGGPLPSELHSSVPAPLELSLFIAAASKREVPSL